MSMTQSIDMPKDTKLLIDADGVTFAAGFAAEKAKYRVHFGWNEEQEGYLFSTDFDYKKDVDALLKEEGFEEGEYEIEKWRDVEPLANALANCRNMLNGLLESLNSNIYELYLTGKDNFRYDVATIQPYKGNRKDVARPTHEKAIRQYMIDNWGAIVIDGQEADDAVSIRQTMLGDRSCIVSADKDLDMVPGWHSKLRKGKEDDKLTPYYVTEEEGLLHFYTQLLTGDPTDNIQGVPGIGKVKAGKLLQAAIERGHCGETQCCLESVLFEAVSGAYEVYHRARAEESSLTLTDSEIETGVRAAIRETGVLLWMRRELNEMWQLPGERES